MNFKDPFGIVPPHERWTPSQTQLDLYKDIYQKILPPLVQKVRMAVAVWRENDYEGASETSKALLYYWFQEVHSQYKHFRFFFAQQEAIESIIYLYEVAKAHNKHELLQFDSSESLTPSLFDEVWTRYVIKMATGTGKTKVIALTLVWAYFHKCYEKDSTLSKNFLIIAPNIIVLNRLLKDFKGLKMFYEEPFIPYNGFEDKNWLNDFQMTLHIQDEVKTIADTTANMGNIFLTNIHRVFPENEVIPTDETTFLGTKPKTDADRAKNLDVGKLLRSDKIKDLVILNDEAHHIHDKEMGWFRAIEDISNQLKLKTGKQLSLQIDYSATPKYNNGSIFVQTICDYPLVEAINNGVVKSPVLPDQESRKLLQEKDSIDFIEKYGDFIRLGVTEWQQQAQEFEPIQKKPILFIMTMNTKEADEAAKYLETTYDFMKNAVLTIHTNKEGGLPDDTKGKKAKEELDILRKAVDDIDSNESKYKAVVSVLMLREGWDVKNVTTIVGLRPFNAKSDILPEQAIGRGLRKMLPLNEAEKLVVIGTEAFLEFVESLKEQGVDFQYTGMGQARKQQNTIVIEIDKAKSQETIAKLDIPLPILTARVQREYKNLQDLNIQTFDNQPLRLKEYKENETKTIVFQNIEGEFSHQTEFLYSNPNYRNIIGFFAEAIMKQNRLIGVFHILYPKIEEFIRYKLFNREVEIDKVQTIRNLAEVEAKNMIKYVFKTEIDKLTITDKGNAEITHYLWLKNILPKIVENQKFLISKKSVFNKSIGDNDFELDVLAAFENRFNDVLAYAKNTMGINGVEFCVEYQAEDGNIRQYYPDFFVKTDNRNIFIVETKGRQDLDDIRKINRLKTWCEDVNKAQQNYTYTPVYVRQEKWDEIKKDLKLFQELVNICKL